MQEWREQLRNKLEEGITVAGGSYESEMITAQMVGNLAVIKQIQALDYDFMVSVLEDL